MAMSPPEEAFFVEASCLEGTREGSYFAGLVEGGENRGRTSVRAGYSVKCTVSGEIRAHYTRWGMTTERPTTDSRAGG
jgi:hypothetical protein